MRPPSTAAAVELGQLRHLARARRDDGGERANAIWKQLLGEYQPPPIDPAIDEALRDFMERRKREGGAPAN